MQSLTNNKTVVAGAAAVLLFTAGAFFKPSYGCGGNKGCRMQSRMVQKIQKVGRHIPSATELGMDQAPIRVAVTGAAGQIGSFLCHFIAQGRMFGPYQKVILHLVELPMAEKALQGL